MTIYDGLVDQPDDYHQWFSREKPGHKAEEGWSVPHVCTISARADQLIINPSNYCTDEKCLRLTYVVALVQIAAE
jgi:hypothetical protein